VTWIVLSIAFGAGLALGSAFFLALRENVALYLRPDRRLRGIALHLGRLVLMCAALLLAARLGADILLAVTAGVLAARFAIVGRSRPATAEGKPR